MEILGGYVNLNMELFQKKRTKRIVLVIMLKIFIIN